ncbi:hypothetical protein AXF42_Ash005174 [Apostasia shenzhenica]|uniref:QLQ domain-containing protein n=1 Tax=Apostasia shenzhenica TaxID=1088818 RepID=A0A2I0B8T4_9ASPA|nr:hypothetical protein AXF42_Ash005174 [Apostasia shenzhenica]
MDYDESNLQSHNFQIVGEDKFPASLQSFALPKFELDEHLRLDNLVDTEALLGLQGQGSNWIDFSTGSSAIEFSSTAAECCSISRHNNAWSEATSSESVEMLLKSVGDEEVIIKKTVTMESSANNGSPSANNGSHGVDNPARVIVEDDKKNNQFLQKSDVLVVLDEKRSNSVFTDRLLVNISCQDKSLKDDNVLDDNFFGKEQQVIQSSKDQDADFEDNTDYISCNTISNMSNLGEGCRTISCGQPCNSIEVDSIYHARNSSIKNPLSSYYEAGNLDSCMDAIDKNSGSHGQLVGSSNDDVEGGNLDSCMDASNKNSRPHGQLVGSSNDNVEDATQFLADSHTSAHPTPDTQEFDFQRLSGRPLGFSSEKFESAVDGNLVEDRDDRLEGKVDANKDKASDDCSVLSDVESKSSVPCLNPLPVDADGISIVEKVQDTPPAGLQAAKEVSLNYSSPSKLVQEELVSVDSVKSLHIHLPSPDDTSDTLPKESITESLSTSAVIHSDKKDLGFFGDPAPLLPIDLVPEKATDIASSSYTFNAKVPPESRSKDESGMKLPSKLETTNSLLSQETLGSNSVIEQKVDMPSSCLSVRDFCSSEGNETKCPQGSGLFETGISQDENNLKRIGIGSHCLKDSPINVSTEDHEHAVVQPLCTVQRTDYTSCQNKVPSSTGVNVGNGSSLQQEGNDIGHGSHMEGNRETPLQFEACSSVRTDSVTSENNLISHGNDSYQISIVQSGNPSSTEHNFQSSTVISCRACPEDDSGFKEQNGSFIGCKLEVSGNMALISCENVGMKVDSGNHVSKQTVTTDKGRGFAFDDSTSGNLPEKETESDWKSFQSSQSTDNTQQEKPQEFPKEKEELDFSSKTSNGKSRDASRNSTDRKVGSKRKAKKEAFTPKSSKLDVKYFTGTTKSSGPLNKERQVVEMQGSFTENSAVKTLSFPVHTSSIPDLNSTSSSSSFQQPFTDLQQVQLRAQIFAYGALISGMPPDEAYMVSAFGDTDGGRKLWESMWLASVARCRNLNSPIGAIWMPEQVLKGNNVQSEVPSIVSTKSAMSPDVLNSTVPLPSPLLSISSEGIATNRSRGTSLDFNQTTPPPCPYRPPQLSQCVGANSPWLAQSSRPGPWFASTQGSAHSGIRQHSTAPAAETLNITHTRDLCGPMLPSIQVVSPGMLVSNVGTATLNTEPSLQIEIAKMTEDRGSSKYSLTSHKARKKKKDATAEKPSLLASQTAGDSVAPSNVIKHALPLPNLPLASNLPVRVADGASVSSTMTNITFPAHYQIICSNSNSNNHHQRTFFSEETCNKVEQARQQAEDAAAIAASTVKHSQAIWSQLATQKNSGLVSETEEKLASAAVAAAAAASVAKAATAAAKVACDAALQAKIMADEAINVAKLSTSSQRQECDTLDVGKRLTGLTPISILKGKDNVHGSSTFISAAREAARRRVESASAATKRAENLDAILKAAELAAEAVAQAGTIISMGDLLPFTLSDLVDTGSEDFWKNHHFTSTKLVESSTLQVEEHSGLQSANKLDTSAKQFDEHFQDVKEMEKIAHKETLSSLNEIQKQNDATFQGNLLNAEHESDHSLKHLSMQRGSIVEVMSNEDCLKGAWFSARVLDIKDNQVYVCYKDVSINEGELKEWIVLESDQGKPPRIRTPHSTTAVKHEGTRKRRREHLGSYLFAVGDHVDAWIHDRWWEGSVAEKCPGDETKLIVHLPARSDKQVVQAWNLRPSLIWSNGQWMEWSLPGEKLVKPLEGDTPQVKRQRLGRRIASTEVDGGGISKHSKDIQFEESRKPEDPESLKLSAKDANFSIGRQNVSGQSTSDTCKIKRTGLQKEGSRVVFGIPKPGKKRKFMDVSKHYVADKSENTSKGNDSIKFTRYLMPQTSRVLRNSTEVDTKGKKNNENKSKGVVKAESLKSLQTRSQAQKERSLSITFDGEHTAQASGASSFTGNSNSLEKMDTFEVGSFPNNSELTDVLVVESDSSMQPAPPVRLLKGKKAAGSEIELAVNGKSTLDRTSKSDDRNHENPGKEISEIMEPRRSNRKIQPTSRLLEGLQSSLIITKIPSTAHERKVIRGGSSLRGYKHN